LDVEFPILSTPYRADRELFWIKELGTAIAMITSKEWEIWQVLDAAKST
jgi:hypothetical protein